MLSNLHVVVAIGTSIVVVMVVTAVVVEVVVTVVVDGCESGGGLVVMGGKGYLPECHSGAPMSHTSLSSLGV